ncbi:response regulator [Massilia forsythiae]|uniref:histidine kinase n=1 Tax=Massilia forsythiae TaxID=2728020 RepID=A0A7Z2VU52_9BURK|nr:ATP-binding protein [Massilia forsythiae]QJD98969.1 response regulator [Massilia forsythiae]
MPQDLSSDNKGSADDVLTVEELAHRPPRPRDERAENAALSALAHCLAASPRTVLQQIAEQALALCGADAAGVSILDGPAIEGQAKYPGMLAGTLRRHALAERAAASAGAAGAIAQAAEVLAVPWRLDGTVRGAVWIATRHAQRRFDGGDARLLDALGGFAAAAWRLGDQSSDLDAMRRLYGLHARLATETELQPALDLILRSACAFAHAEHGCVQLTAADGSFETVARRGSGGDGDGDGDGVPYRSTPMVNRNGETVGMLRTGHPSRQPPGDEAVRLVDMLAWTAADFVERQRALEQLRRNEQRQAFLLELNDVLRPLSDPAQVQAEAARVLGQHLHASRVGYGIDEGSGHLAISRAYANGVAQLDGLYRYDDFGAHLLPAFRSGHLVVHADIASEPLGEEAQRAHAALQIAASVNAPLVKDGALVAILFVHQDRPRRWSKAEIGLMQETAERTWAAIERARAEQALQEADRRKDEFLATLAHELRNPLAPISNAVHLMRRPDGRRVTDRLMGIVERQVKQIVKLVDDLLEISRITRGKIELDRQVVELADAVRDAVETSRPLVERAHHQLTVSLPEQPLTVLADSMRLTQIVTNLVNNAAKYTEAGGHIWLSAMHEGDDVAIRVRDNGLGIPDSELPRVFEMFAQAHQHAAVSGADGLGIGLAIVRKLVEMHGGTVEAHSAGVHQGSEFVVRLPLLHDAEAEGDDTPLPERGELEDQRIMVVDDNRDAADTLSLLLESHGAVVRTFYDGRSALAALDGFAPGAVLLDLGMPEMDGLTVARYIRAEARFAGTRLLALSGWGQEADRQRTRAAGFDHHLTKPVDFPALQAWLTSAPAPALAAAQAAPCLAPSAPVRADAPPSPPSC